MTSSKRVFAIVPAAGHSRRMGRPKLTLPLGAQTAIEHVLTAIDLPQVTCRAVVVRTDDRALAALVNKSGASVMTPLHDPPDMRTSVEEGIRFIEAHHAPTEDDSWMLLPGDCVGLTQATVRRVLQLWSECDADILVPCSQGSGGHPTLFRWPLANVLRGLAPSLGVNALMKLPHYRVLKHEMGLPGVTQDMDTPEDYNKAIESLDPESGTTQ